ncbi:MAG TPA: hypothetical protein VFI91_08950 [Longimicrobiaceae bacterium]|nr:hypothetical protein [Longimicrobiaceae bacterium]
MKERGIELEAAILSVGPGWETLVKEAWHLVTGTRGKLNYIKEKFGSLSLFFSLGKSPPEVLHRIWEIEKQSEKVCELCADPGEPYPIDIGPDMPLSLRWIKTTCPAHTCARIEGAGWWDLLEEYRPLTPSQEAMRDWQKRT